MPLRSGPLQTETFRIRSVQRSGDVFMKLTRSRTLNVFVGASFALTYVQSLLMEADLQSMVDAGKLNIKAAAALDQLKPQTFCLHKSWGFGQISSWNLLLNQIVVDFDTKKNHSMQLQYAAETLQPLPDTHIFVRKVNEPDVLRDLAKNDVPQLVELVLESFGGKATQEQLQRALSPEIVSEGDFKKWWESAKRAIAKRWPLLVAGQKNRTDHDARRIDRRSTMR